MLLIEVMFFDHFEFDEIENSFFLSFNNTSIIKFKITTLINLLCCPKVDRNAAANNSIDIIGVLNIFNLYRFSFKAVILVV